MAVRTRFQPQVRALTLQVSRQLDPKARAKLIAGYARKGLAEAQETNRQALGTIPPHDTFVDGRKGAPLESVDPESGTILFAFHLFRDVTEWVDAMLVMHSPVLTGRYARSHVFYADGTEADAQNPPAAREYVFLNVTPYARKIERGQSRQAPDGVYEAVAALAGRRFGNLASVAFGFRSPLLSYVAGGANRAERAAVRRQGARRSAMAIEKASRVPAIIIKPR